MTPARDARAVLIEPGSQWPPPGHGALRARWQSWRAWWSGDIADLKRHAPTTAPGGYWARKAAKPGGREIHLPLAWDLSRTSAALVAGDTPALEWASTGEADTWETISQEIGWSNSLLEGFQIGSALGGFYLRPAWDEQVAGHPLLTVVAQDEALPEFRFGRLWQVTFVQELPPPEGWRAQDKGEVWRHLEHHEPGAIRHELWLGNMSRIGRPVPLAEHPTTRFYTGQIDTRAIRPIGDGLLVDYVPNVLPNPLTGMPIGTSDYQGGIETLFDAADSALDSWWRDIDLGKARILLSKEMLDPVGQTSSSRWRGRRGDGATPAQAFDVDAAVFSPLEMPAEDGGKVTPITLVQFEIRFEAHKASLETAVEQAVQRAGMAPQSMGMNIDGQLSGAAMHRRELRSHRTKGDKQRYARAPIQRNAETMMRINGVHFGGPAVGKRPTLGWKETDQADPLEMAQVLAALRVAEAASTEVLVAMAHPEWDEPRVKQEAAAIMAERKAMAAPVLTGDESIEPGPADDDRDA